MNTTTSVLTLMVAALVTGAAAGSDFDSSVVNRATARQYAYYDELDLDRFADLETEFAATSRVIPSTTAARLGKLEVRARLVVPRSDAPVSRGLFDSNDPEPVRIMLDYALVSCRHGCTVTVLTDKETTASEYEATHESEVLRKRRAPAGGQSKTMSHRTASMVVIKGRDARKAIKQMNGAGRARVILYTAVHGVADFEFDMSGGVQ